MRTSTRGPARPPKPAPGLRLKAQKYGQSHSGLIRKAQPYALISPALLVLTALFIFPAIYNIGTSFRDATPFSVAREESWVGWENYIEVFQDPLTWDATTNTVLFLTAATVIIRVVVGVLIAVLLNAAVLRRWKLQGIARTLVLIPWMVPPAVAVAAWKWLLDPQSGIVNQILINLGLIDEGIAFFANTSTVWAAIGAIVVWRELPFVVIVVTAGLQSIPREQYEAAWVDGADGIRAFRFVTLPNLAPVILVVSLLTTLQTFNNFVYVWLSTGGGPGTYSQVLATQLFGSAFVANDLGRGAATGNLMMLVMALFVAIYLSIAFRKDR